MPTQQIIAIGGGGYQREPAYAKIEDYLLEQTGQSCPKVCFVPTASGDDMKAIITFYTNFAGGRTRPSHLALHGVPRTDIKDFLLEQDLIYVGGGNTANMLAVWRIHGVDRALREAYDRGIPLAGWSAGMICWFSCSITDSYGPLAALRDGLGFLPYSACPHYDGEVQRRPTYHRLIEEGFPAGYAADDLSALHFKNGELYRCVTAKPLGRCYRVAQKDSQVVEECLSTDLLGSP